jgi:hypothetical protein
MHAIVRNPLLSSSSIMSLKLNLISIIKSAEKIVPRTDDIVKAIKPYSILNLADAEPKELLIELPCSISLKTSTNEINIDKPESIYDQFFLLNKKNNDAVNNIKESCPSNDIIAEKEFEFHENDCPKPEALDSACVHGRNRLTKDIINNNKALIEKKVHEKSLTFTLPLSIISLIIPCCIPQ